MTKIFLIFSFPFLLLNVNAQQSTTGKYCPDNISKGFINTSKTQVVIENVPSYLWRYGCGPTALGMIIGYYDILGYEDLISGDALSQTDEVNNAMANSKHYDDYSFPLDYSPNLKTDKSTDGGAHTSNCIADFMETSWSSKSNYYGWSWSNKIDDAFRNYITMKNSNYQTYTTYKYFNNWDAYKNEINNKRPVVLLVDTDGDGGTDHFITGIGYDETNLLYAVYDTWDNNIHWFDWRGISNGNTWGIYGFNILQISTSTSLNTISENKIKIFPSPAKDYVFIDINDEVVNNRINVYLYNYLGSLCISKQFFKNESLCKLDISNINSGYYFLKIMVDDIVFENKKILIVK